jgi:hypothetical protein
LCKEKSKNFHKKSGVGDTPTTAQTKTVSKRFRYTNILFFRVRNLAERYAENIVAAIDLDSLYLAQKVMVAALEADMSPVFPMRFERTLHESVADSSRVFGFIFVNIDKALDPIVGHIPILGRLRTPRYLVEVFLE